MYAFSVLDYFKLKSIDHYRIHYSKVEKRRPRLYPTNAELLRALRVSGGVFFGLYLPLFIVLITAANFLEIYPYSFAKELPEHWLFEIVLCSIASDSLFYWLHRLAHHPKVYSKMHKMHHEWIYTIALAHHYMSWEEALMFTLPPIIPPLLCGAHISTVYVMVLWTNLNGVMGHSAYCIPFLNSMRLPFLNPAYHDLHHLRFNVNYGAVYSFTDIMWGTFREEPIVYMDGVEPVLAAEAEKKAASSDGTEKKDVVSDMYYNPSLISDSVDPFNNAEVRAGGYIVAGS